MDSLRLYRFKAFNDEINIPFNNKNLLLYGENGAGKSSIYEAIKYIFFKEKLESQITSSTPEDQRQKLQDFRSRYNNKIDNQDFEIDINGISFRTFDSTGYQVFMISLEDLKINDSVHLPDLIEKAFLNISEVDKLCADFYMLIEEEVNSRLLTFNEAVKIEIIKEDNYAIKFVDFLKNIQSTSEIKIYFNEAKINAILLLILLSVVKLSEVNRLKKTLVLDDFITSLDSSNRIFLIKYILEFFSDSKIFIFTHNISFYNLVMYVINMKTNSSTSWLFGNLYEINNCHKIYFKNETESVIAMRNNFLQAEPQDAAVDLTEIGNKLRKKFEILLYEFSKLLMIGAVEDSNKIIERIKNSKSAYYNGGDTASDLVDNIQYILSENNPHNLSTRLSETINQFRSPEFINFKKIINELKLYQKVTMHPLSHATQGIPTFTYSEIIKSLDLLEKMENYIERLVNGNVSTI